MGISFSVGARMVTGGSIGNSCINNGLSGINGLNTTDQMYPAAVHPLASGRGQDLREGRFGARAEFFQALPQTAAIRSGSRRSRHGITRTA
jgi:hypothetical protein